MAVAIVAAAAAVAVPAAVIISAAARFLTGKIAALLLRRPPFNLAHFLRTGLALRALEGALLVVAVHGLPVHALHGSAILPLLPTGLGVALLAEGMETPVIVAPLWSGTRELAAALRPFNRRPIGLSSAGCPHGAAAPKISRTPRSGNSGAPVVFTRPL